MSAESNLIDFTQLGGFRFEQPTLNKLQATSYLFLKAMIGHFGIPDVGNFIISGCNIDGANITEGIMYIDGVICPFEEIAGTLATKIKKLVTTESLEFQNGTTPAVFQKFTAVVDASGTALSDFIRVPSPFNLPANLVIDANYVHTDNNFTDAFLVHLASIQFGAEVNVQTDWNVINPESIAYLKNKPSGLARVLKEGIVIVGDITDVNVTSTINFGDIGLTDTDYHPIITIESISNEIGQVKSAAKMGHVIYDKLLTSFKVCFQENSGAGAQNIQIRYSIIKPAT